MAENDAAPAEDWEKVLREIREHLSKETAEAIGRVVAQAKDVARERDGLQVELEAVRIERSGLQEELRRHDDLQDREDGLRRRESGLKTKEAELNRDTTLNLMKQRLSGQETNWQQHLEALRIIFQDRPATVVPPGGEG